jgi:hypothetical protein
MDVFRMLNKMTAIEFPFAERDSMRQIPATCYAKT